MMTILASWIAADSHGPASAYIMADSRITWTPRYQYNYCKKLFICRTYPDIFGYAGDVLFPSVVLAQIVEMIDYGLLFDGDLSPSEKNSRVCDKLENELKHFPASVRDKTVQILHVSRDTCVDYVTKGYPSFSRFLMEWNEKNELISTADKFTVENSSTDSVYQRDKLRILGTGKADFETKYAVYQKRNNQNTSRNVYHCFINVVLNSNNSTYGGVPQLVGLYRKPQSCGLNFGIVYKGKRYLLGSEIPDIVKRFNGIEWRNENFELCDGNSLAKLPEAMRQPL